MTDRELMQMALDWADNHGEVVFAGGGWNAVNPMNEWTRPLRARLAQPEPEPVAWIYEFGTDNADAVNEIRWYKNVHLTKPTGMVRNVVPLYTAPPQREWQGLTDEDIKTRWDDHIIPVFNKNGINPFVFARAIEAKLKEKNT